MFKWASINAQHCYRVVNIILSYDVGVVCYALNEHTVICMHILMPVVFSCEEAEVRADQAAKLMTTVKAGVEHLAEKLQHLKAVCT